jgi:putative membrane protein
MRTLAGAALAAALLYAAFRLSGDMGLTILFATGPICTAIGDKARDWTFDLWITGPLVGSGLLYFEGAAALWRRAGHGRDAQSRRVVAFCAGWVALIGALVSPLHHLGAQLFTFHMIEHEIVMAIAAPLLALARPSAAFLWALPRALRRVVGLAMRAAGARMAWSTITKPTFATIVHGVTIWAWHAPVLFDAAVVNAPLHRLQHVSFLITGLLFWWAMFRRADRGAACGHVFVTMLHTSLLGALLTLAPRVLYRVQTAHAADWGLTPLEDQQLAGLVMWIPAGAVYAGAALFLFALWIQRSGKTGGPESDGETLEFQAPAGRSPG